MAASKRKPIQLNEYLVDLIIIIFIATVVLFVLGPNQFMNRLGYYLTTAYAIVRQYTKLGIKIIFGVILVGIVYWRILYHIGNSQLWKSDRCPKCGKSYLKRIHRTRFDRFISSITRLHFHRYACPSCKWNGLLRSTDRAHRILDELSQDNPSVTNH